MAETLSSDVRRECEREAWVLRHTARWSLERIGEQLGVDASTVHRMLDRVEVEFQKRFSDKVLAFKIEQTLLLRKVAEDALAAWERSKENAVTVTSGKTVVDRMGNEHDLKDEVTTAGQCGNPSYLAQARGAWSDIRAIWGLEAPKGVDVTSGGEPVKLYQGIPLDEV